MSTLTIVLIIILVVLLALLAFLYFYGKKAMKQQDEQNEVIARTQKPISMLILDKKKLRLKDCGLPPEMLAQTNFFMRLSKVPMIKAKVGPRVMSLMVNPDIYDSIPLKKEVKAMLAGYYVASIRELHGKSNAASEPTKKSLASRLRGFISKNG